MSSIQLTCSTCKCSFKKEMKEYNRRLRLGKNKFYCNKNCQFAALKKTYNKVCKKCNKKFNAPSEKKNKMYCSYACSSSKKHSMHTKLKISTTLKTRYENTRIKKYCVVCNKQIFGRKKYCDVGCKTKYAHRNLSEYNSYKLKCQFKFNLKDFKDEFDFDLIEKFGWYKAKNRGDNLDGVSRDHMYSINEGFKNDIDPYYISHPANCKLLQQTNNSKKFTNCSITLLELKKKILEWNEKYNLIGPVV